MSDNDTSLAELAYLAWREVTGATAEWSALPRVLQRGWSEAALAVARGLAREGARESDAGRLRRGLVRIATSAGKDPRELVELANRALDGEDLC